MHPWQAHSHLRRSRRRELEAVASNEQAGKRTLVVVEAGATATHDRLSSAAAAHADVARRAHYAHAEAHRVALEYFAAAEAATANSGMVQIGTRLRLQAPAAAYNGQPQMASIVALTAHAAGAVGTNDMSTTKEGDTRISLVMSESKYR